MLLGSATPSIESYFNVHEDKYGLVQLKERFGKIMLPEVELVDIKEKYRKKRMSGHFSDRLVKLMEEALAAKKQIILCIDEFQNISEFDHPVDFQKKLRAHWQLHQHVTYCLYGSKRHMLMEVFSSPSMPFYKFGDIIFLENLAPA